MICGLKSSWACSSVWEGDPDIKRAHLMIDIFSQVNIWACSSVGRAYGSHPYGRTSTCEFQSMISERFFSEFF